MHKRFSKQDSKRRGLPIALIPPINRPFSHNIVALAQQPLVTALPQPTTSHSPCVELDGTFPPPTFPLPMTSLRSFVADSNEARSPIPWTWMVASLLGCLPQTCPRADETRGVREGSSIPRSAAVSTKVHSLHQTNGKARLPTLDPDWYLP